MGGTLGSLGQPWWSKARGHGHRVPHSLHLLQQPADRARSAPLAHGPALSRPAPCHAVACAVASLPKASISSVKVARTPASSSRGSTSGSFSRSTFAKGSIRAASLPSASSKAARVRRGRRFAVCDRLREVGFDELVEAVRLAAIEPDHGGDVLLLLRAEIAD